MARPAQTRTIVGASALREALARVATPVSVVTTIDSGGQARGVTVGTLCSVSLTPPLVMFCLDRSGRSHGVFTTTERILIHVLRDDQAPIAAQFARTDQERFDSRWASWLGLPAIPGAALRLACIRHAVVEGGDHTIVICRVEEAEIGRGDPLLYYSRGYCAPLPLELRPGQVIAGSRV